MSQTPILSLRSARLSVGDKLVFKAGNLHILPRDRIGLVGRNGVGKSTFLRLLSGQSELDSGEYIKQARLQIGSLQQEVFFENNDSVYQFMSKDMGAAAGTHVPSQISRILAMVKLSPDRNMGELSGGEVRRASLARAILWKPDLLLLDEPTNQLDLQTIEWLENWLVSYSGAVVLVSHDRALLRRVTDRTIWLYDQRLEVHDGGFDSFERWSAKLRAFETETGKRQSQKLLEEERWLARGVTARRKRNQGRLRKLKILREQRRGRTQEKEYKISDPYVVEGGGALALEAKAVSMRYGSQQILQEFSIRIRRGDRIAIMGPNGVGKTTLLRILIGDLVPQTGAITLAPKTHPLYLDQHRSVFNHHETVWEALCSPGSDTIEVNGRPQHIVGYLRKFLFSESQLRRPISSLSGGERSRLLLAKTFAASGNLFGFDEPTNDLDVETLDLLQEIVSDYRGTVLFVSHDREFVENIATSILAMDGRGFVTEYIGGYFDYLRLRPPLQETVAKNVKVKTRRASGPRTSLGYKEGRELAVLPDEISVLDGELRHLEKILSDPTLYQRDRKTFDRVTNETLRLRTELQKRESRWVELEEKQEALREIQKGKI